MKKLLSISTIILLATSSIYAFNGYHKYRDMSRKHFYDKSLTDKEMEDLAFMWNEEKMAKDLYIELYKKSHIRAFAKIGYRSESRHQKNVEKLMIKYNVGINGKQPYDKSEIANIESGQFTNEHIQEVYNELLKMGQTSKIDALKVGCMVEVTDINDLNEKIENVKKHKDIVRVFNNLKRGSYKHYNAFDRLLKRNGIKEGCCILGSNYCIN